MDNVPVNKQVTLARKICRLTANLLFPFKARCKIHTTNNRRDKSSPPEPSNPITVDSQNCNTNKAQNKDLKIVFINMIKFLKKEINKFLKKCRRTQTVEGET